MALGATNARFTLLTGSPSLEIHSSAESLAAIKSLQAVKLDYTVVTDKAIEALKALPNLRELSLDYTNITDRGVEMLRAIPTLRSLDLYHTKISRSAYLALKASLPQCLIFYDEQSGLPSRRGT